MNHVIIVEINGFVSVCHLLVSVDYKPLPKAFVEFLHSMIEKFSFKTVFLHNCCQSYNRVYKSMRSGIEFNRNIIEFIIAYNKCENIGPIARNKLILA